MGLSKDELARIYDELARPLFVCALAITSCPGLAEDAMHNAFSKLLSLKQQPEDLKIYVFRYVRNAAIDLNRKRRRHNFLLANYVFDSSSPEEEASASEFKSKVAAELLRLRE